MLRNTVFLGGISECRTSKKNFLKIFQYVTPKSHFLERNFGVSYCKNCFYFFIFQYNTPKSRFLKRDFEVSYFKKKYFINFSRYDASKSRSEKRNSGVSYCKKIFSEKFLVRNSEVPYFLGGIMECRTKTKLA